MEKPEKDRLDKAIYDYNKKPRSGNAIKSVDHTLFFTWNKRLHKWTLRQKVDGRLHVVGHYRSESEGIQEARRMKGIKYSMRKGELEANTAAHNESIDAKRDEVLDEMAEEETERAFFDSKVQPVTVMNYFGD